MTDEALFQEARDIYVAHMNGDLTIDNDAQISRADGGAWVQAWVWVQYPEGSDA